MQSLSSAIIAAAGVFAVVAGAFISHGDTSLFVMSFGFVIAVLGLVGWGLALLFDPVIGKWICEGLSRPRNHSKQSSAESF